MKKSLLLLFSLAVNTLQATDTLRYYQQGRYFATSFSNTTYPKQIARFEPQGPATVKSIIVTLGGNIGGTAKVRMFGHEGGASHPQLQADLFTPVTITKTTADINERIEIKLDSLNIRVENNQFFVALSNMQNVLLRLGQDIVPPACSASQATGGEYFYTTAENNSGRWALNSNRPIAVDVVLEYDALPQQPWFVDVDDLSGIRSGGNIKGNVAVGNIDGDSHLDILLGKNLYKNNGDGTFTNVTLLAGIDNSTYMHANMFIDMDNDGDDDIIFICHNPTLNLLYLNDGSGRFAGKPLYLPVDFDAITSFSIADINTDGYPDLFVGQLWQPYGTPMPNFLLVNDQKLGFTNGSSRLSGNTLGFSRGSQWVDYDNDSDLDLFVANYAASLAKPTSYDNFFRNNGDGTFENIISGTPIDNNNGTLFYNMSTGCDWADYDNDGDMDLLHSNFSHPRNMPPSKYQAPWGFGGSNITVDEDTRMTCLFENEGAPNFTFKDLTGQVSQKPGQISATGLQFEETHANAAFGDLNNDGLQDIITTTYYPCNFNDVYIQQPNHTFALKTFQYGLNKVNGAENTVFVDYDNDGKLDALMGTGGKFYMYKNNAQHGGNFVSIDLRGTTVNKNAIGARVWVWAEEKAYMQDVVSGRGICSQKSGRLFFGIGKHPKIDSVVVRWPGKPATEKFSTVTINTLNILTEGGQVALSRSELQPESTNVAVSPNPFSNEVNFKFHLKEEKPVSLQIFDGLGRSVYYTNTTFAPGPQMVSWQATLDGETLPQGVYMYRIQVGQMLQNGTLVKQ